MIIVSVLAVSLTLPALSRVQKLKVAVSGLATGGLVPDLTVLFDVSIEESITRTTRRSAKNKRDRLDTEAADFHARVREEYLRIARAEPERVKVIDTTGTVDETQEKLRAIVVPFLQSRDQLTTRLVDNEPYKLKRGHC